jgi:predicted DNA-binding mobile mystery protein A
VRDNLLVVRQLDQRFLAIAESEINVPREGWVRTIRKALGMTIKQFAKRLGVAPSRIVKIEVSEIEDAVTLRTLRMVAEQLDCTFVYALVPKSSLENTIRNRAQEIVNQQIKRTAHTMDLEAQSVSQEWLQMQKEELVREVLSKNWKYLWEEK